MPILYDYIIALEQPNRDVLAGMYRVVKQMVPDAEEASSYGMPAFKFNKRPLVSFIAAKDHLSLFPFSAGVVAAFSKKLGDYELSKGTIRFSADKPLPKELLKEIVSQRLREISGGA